jgi:hypothetical protein
MDARSVPATPSGAAVKLGSLDQEQQPRARGRVVPIPLGGPRVKDPMKTGAFEGSVLINAQMSGFGGEAEILCSTRALPV